MSGEFVIVGKVDDFGPGGNGLYVLLTQLSEEGVGIVLEFVALNLQHSASNGHCVFF